MDTPFQWTQQIASHLGGTRNAMIVRWPARHQQGGEICQHEQPIRLGRMRFMLAVVLMLAPLGFGLGPAQSEDGEDQAQRTEVEDGIKRGLAWLFKQQASDGAIATPGADGDRVEYGPRVGETALALLTLARIEGKPASGRIRRGLSYLRKAVPVAVHEGIGQLHRSTYTAGLTLELLATVYGAEEGRRRSRPKWAADMAAELCEWLLTTRTDSGLWGYPSERADVSNSAIAVAGLMEAEKLGIEPPAELKEVVEVLLSWQVVDRAGGSGWGYSGGSYLITGSSTTSAAFVLAATKPAAPTWSAELQARATEGLAQSMKWLSRTLVVDADPQPREPSNQVGFPHWYLYFLGRTCRSLGQERLGERDWYREGAESLIRSQTEDGSWVVRGEEAVAGARLQATCFALLFLALGDVDEPPSRGSAPRTPR